MAILASTAPSVPVQVVNVIDILFSRYLNDEDVAARASKEVRVIWKNIRQKVLSNGSYIWFLYGGEIYVRAQSWHTTYFKLSVEIDQQGAEFNIAPLRLYDPSWMRKSRSI